MPTMPNLSVSLLSIIGADSIGQIATPAAGNADGFKALLDIGSDKSDNTPDPNQDAARKPETDNNASNVLAAPVSVPTTVFVDHQAADKDSTDSQVQSKQDGIKQDDASQNNTAQNNAADNNAATTNTGTAGSADKTSTGEAQPAKNTSTDTAKTASANATDAAKPAAAAANATADAVVTSAAQNDNQQKPQLSANLAKLLAMLEPVTTPTAHAIAPGATDTPAMPQDLAQYIANIRDLLQQIQTLRDNTASAGQSPNFTNLVDALQKNVTDLQHWLSMNLTPLETNPTSIGLDPSALKDMRSLLNTSVRLIIASHQTSDTPPPDTTTPPTANIKPAAAIKPQAAADTVSTVKPAEGKPVELADKPLTATPAPANTASVTPAQTQAAAKTDAVNININPNMNTDTNTIVPTAIAPAADTGQTANDAGANANSGNGNSGSGIAQPLLNAASIGQSDAATNSGGVSFSRVLTQAQQASVPEQVMFQIKTAVADGSSKIRIQLDPAELGKLDIKLHVTADGKTGVIITADNKDTLAMLQRDARGLEQALNDAGLKTDSNSLSFNLRGQQNGQGQQDRSYGSLPYQPPAEEEDDVSLATISKSYVINLAEGLDIKI